MSLPPLSPAKPHFSIGSQEIDTPSPIFKRTGNASLSNTSAFKLYNDEVQTTQPKFMTGYGGFQPQQDAVEEIPRVIVAPVVGYTGNYRGRNIGKLGRVEVHKTRLSAWEKDTVSGILGVPHTHNDWEYSHYTNGCQNFAEKKYHECGDGAGGLANSFVSSMGSVSLASSGGADLGGQSSHHPQQQQQQFSDGLAAATNARNSPSLLQHQHLREETETDRILSHIQQSLESKFKTSLLARSALKTAFFSLDRQRSGLLTRGDFFAVLYKVAGVTLSEERCLHLTRALSTAGHHHQYHHHNYNNDGFELESEVELDAANLEIVNFGRFLNILVPRSPGGHGEGGGGGGGGSTADSHSPGGPDGRSPHKRGSVVSASKKLGSSPGLSPSAFA